MKNTKKHLIYKKREKEATINDFSKLEATMSPLNKAQKNFESLS